eukprot:g48133.t1
MLEEEGSRDSGSNAGMKRTLLHPSSRTPDKRGTGPRLNPPVQTRRLSQASRSAARPRRLLAEMVMSLVPVQDPAAPAAAALARSAQRELMAALVEVRWCWTMVSFCSSSDGMVKRSGSSVIGLAAGTRDIGMEEPRSRPMDELEEEA